MTVDGTFATVGVDGATVRVDGTFATVGVIDGATVTVDGTFATVGGVGAGPGFKPDMAAPGPFMPSSSRIDRGDGGAGGDPPPRTKFHEHVTVEDVPGGAPGKFAGNADGAEPVMLACVAAPSITGNGHSSTYGRPGAPVVVPTLRSCAAPAMRTVPSAVSRIVSASGIGWPAVVHCSLFPWPRCRVP